MFLNSNKGNLNKGNFYFSNKGNFLLLWVGTRPQGAGVARGRNPGCNRITPQYVIILQQIYNK
jgi:hypothetical protein